MPYPFSELWFDLLLLAAFLVAAAYCYYVLYRIGRTLGGGSQRAITENKVSPEGAQ